MKRGISFFLVGACLLIAPFAAYRMGLERGAKGARLLVTADPTPAPKQPYIPKTSYRTDIPRPGSVRSSSAQIAKKYPWVGSKLTSGAYELLSHDGKITRQAAEEAGLSDEERQLAQSKFDSFYKKMEKLTLEHMREDASRSDKENGVIAYNITPFGNEGVNVFSGLLSDLTKSLGEDRQKVLMGRYRFGLQYSGMGEYETNLIVKPQNLTGPLANMPDSDYLANRISYEYLDPNTGKRIGSGESGLEDFVRLYGKILEMKVE